MNAPKGSRWVAPPNWPQPSPGWSPPPGWQPDPSWGPAPADWQFWQGGASGDSGSRSRWLNPVVTGVGGLVLGLLLGVGIGAAGSDNGSSDTASSDSSATDDLEAAQQRAEDRREAAEEAEQKRAADEAAAAEAEADAAAEAAAAAPPDPSEFTLAIVVLEKECFGSAGCNVKYRIDPTYTGSRPAVDLEITYEVSGAEDPIINTFTIDELGTASFDSEETASTASSSDELTATVTAVRKAP